MNRMLVFGLATSAATNAYHIGTPGTPWGAAERAQWLSERTVSRSYDSMVRSRIDALQDRFNVEEYGSLSHDPERYPLFCLKSRTWSPELPNVLITGGVHGYETSGVLGALSFLEDHAERYASRCNILVAPCVSPWAFETVQRWNAAAIDPNRSFQSRDLPKTAAIDPTTAWRGAAASICAEESVALMRLVESVGVREWHCHVDLHETTDSDEGEFIPARAASNGIQHEPATAPGQVPDGFYVVGDSGTRLTHGEQGSFLKAVVDAVRKVTHIAPADENGQIIGEPVTQEGAIMYPYTELGLCGSVTSRFEGVVGAAYACTTEVYPDSPTATGEECTEAQVACVNAAIDFMLARRGPSA